MSEARVCQSSCIPAWQAQASVGLWAGVCSWGYRVMLALHSTLFLYQFQRVCMCVCVEWGRCHDRRVSLGMGATTLQEPGGGLLTRGDTQRRFLVKLVLLLNSFLPSLSLSLFGWFTSFLLTNSILFNHKLILLHTFLLKVLHSL